MTEFLRRLLVNFKLLVNNFVLVKFLGLCPFMGVSNKLDTAIGMCLATTFVLTLASLCSYLVDSYILAPLDLGYLRTLSFILVITVVVQFTEMVVHKTSPAIDAGIFLPLITTSAALVGGCAVKCQSQSRPAGFCRVWFWCRCGFFAGTGALCCHARAPCQC